jgi:hypothetical protein
MITINIYMSTYRGFSTIGNEFKTVTTTDFELAKRDLMNNFNVRKGERVMRPEFGCVIWDMLFEQLTEAAHSTIIDNVTAIALSDPRLDVVSVLPTTYEHGIQILISLRYVPTDQVESMLYTFNQDAAIVVANEVDEDKVQ